MTDVLRARGETNQARARLGTALRSWELWLLPEFGAALVLWRGVGWRSAAEGLGLKAIDA